VDDDEHVLGARVHVERSSRRRELFGHDSDARVRACRDRISDRNRVPLRDEHGGPQSGDAGDEVIEHEPSTERRQRPARAGSGEEQGERLDCRRHQRGDRNTGRGAERVEPVGRAGGAREQLVERP
jgi:hypothetical protein